MLVGHLYMFLFSVGILVFAHFFVLLVCVTELQAFLLRPAPGPSGQMFCRHFLPYFLPIHFLTADFSDPKFSVMIFTIIARHTLGNLCLLPGHEGSPRFL